MGGGGRVGVVAGVGRRFCVAVRVAVLLTLGSDLFTGIMLFNGEIPWDFRSNFNDFAHAILTVLQIITGEDWEDVMFETYAVRGLYGLYYCVMVMLAGHYVVLQMFVAILTFTLQQLSTKKLQRVLAERRNEESAREKCER